MRKFPLFSLFRTILFFILVAIYTVLPIQLLAQQRFTQLDLAHKKVATRYVDLAIAQQQVKSINYCDYFYENDIIETLLAALGAISKIENAALKSTTFLEFKKNTFVAPFLKGQFSLRLAVSNLELNAGNYGGIDDLGNVKVLQKALTGCRFHGPAPGIYGSTSYYHFFSTYVEYHYDEDVEVDGPWKVERLSYRIIKDEDKKVLLMIGDQRFKIIHDDYPSKLFKLTSEDKDFDKTFYETNPGECSA